MGVIYISSLAARKFGGAPRERRTWWRVMCALAPRLRAAGPPWEHRETAPRAKGKVCFSARRSPERGSRERGRGDEKGIREINRIKRWTLDYRGGSQHFVWPNSERPITRDFVSGNFEITKKKKFNGLMGIFIFDGSRKRVTNVVPKFNVLGCVFYCSIIFQIIAALD